MHLVLFDIDGTLTQTCAADSACFIRAVSEVLSLSEVESDWTRYRHVTDSGIATELIRTSFNRIPHPGELRKICARFTDLLHECFLGNPSLCRPVAGSPQMLNHLSRRADIAVAIATGGWEQSARLKLRMAGLPVEEVPLASADDSHLREQIMEIAMDRAAKQHSVRNFDSVVYVGDGLWDLVACTGLGVPFIGIGECTHLLATHGARDLIQDYSNQSSFLAMLARVQAGPWPRAAAPAFAGPAEFARQ